MKLKALYFSVFISFQLLGMPSGHKVVSGKAGVASEQKKITIEQQTKKAVVEWGDFSIAYGEKVEILQPSKGAAILNRVVGDNISKIYGALESNGKAYLLNQNGIVIGPEGRIDTAGFIASTLDISNQEFLFGKDVVFKGDSLSLIHISEPTRPY